MTTATTPETHHAPDGAPDGAGLEFPAFNLVDEPWIEVLGHDGTPRVVGLADVFRQADDISQIVGELPTQAFAITRLLLAVLYRAARPADGQDDDEDFWAQLRDRWDEDVVPAVCDYLQDWKDRFWLLHPSEPFFQVAGLSTAKGDVSGLEKLIADVPNGEPMFTTRIGRGLQRIDLAEAARWLVHVHAFDPTGIRSGAVGDSRVKRGKGYPIGPGWAAQISGTWLSGRSLRETLLLNRVGLDVGLLRGGEADLPAWERDPDTAAEADLSGRPSGPVDVYTWQSRRVRLVTSGAWVTGVVLCQGDPLAPQNRLQVEPMTPWRHSEPQSKKLGTRTYMPAFKDPERQVWRGLSSLLPERGTTAAGEEVTIPPGVVAWAARLRDAEQLPDGLHTVRVTWTALGSNNSVVDEVLDDHLSVPALLLATADAPWRAVTRDAVAAADQAATVLAGLAGNLAFAAGKSEKELDAPRSAGRAELFAALDRPFRDWLAHLDHDQVPAEATAAWQSLVRKAALRLARERLGAVGPTAWVGRTNAKGSHIDAGQAEAWFLAGLHKALPHSHTNREE